MAEINFKGTSASDRWQSKAEDLNTRTEDKLKQVSACLTELQTESVGDMVDNIVLAGEEMFNAAADMIKAMQEIVSAVGEFVKEFTNAINEAVSSVESKKSTIAMGGNS